MSSSFYCTAKDGTRLHALHWGPHDASATPLLCLPGLTRNGRDFEPVATEFSSMRSVIAVDLRGRGKSGHADPATYRPDVELADTITLLDRLRIERVAVLGTSRGGIVGVLMANLHPNRIAGLFLVDVGAKLEPEGLLRIAGYLGKPTQFVSWSEAAVALKKSSHGFDGVDDATWQAAARRIYVERNGTIQPDYDMGLASNFPSAADINEGKIADLWPLVPALTKIPLGLLRGSGSDLLSQTTVQKMKEALPHLLHAKVPGRGHVPFLDEPESIAAIREWLGQVG